MESVLEYMTACLPFTSLEEAWHSILEKLKCIKIESKETHNYRDTDFQESEIWQRLWAYKIFVRAFTSENFFNFQLYIHIPLTVLLKPRVCQVYWVKQVVRTFELSFWWEWFCVQTYMLLKKENWKKKM